jgi:hypothetical protein
MKNLRTVRASRNVFNAFTVGAARPVLGGLLPGLLLAATLALGSGACLSVEADVPDVEVTQHGLAFAGIPLANRTGDVSTDLTFTQSLPDLGLPKGIDSSVKAVKIDLVATSGIESFDFLRSLRVTMSPKDSTAAPVELVAYEKADGATVGSILTIPSLNPVNILDQWKADSATFDIQVAGALPEQAWTIDMSVHFAGKVSYKY